MCHCNILLRISCNIFQSARFPARIALLSHQRVADALQWRVNRLLERCEGYAHML